MSGGVMHSIKEKLFSGEKHVDAEYDVAFSRFTQLHDSLVKLKSSAQNYSNSLYSSLFNSNSASIEFASILDDPLTESGYETISKQMQTAHLQLNSDRQSALTARMSEGVLVPLDRMILQLLDLNVKVAKRNELRTNLEYYLGKTSTLLKEREERGSKGKVESASQRDKFDRNNNKLDTVRNEYATYTQPLIVELQAAWQTRAVTVGPILAAFASVEKEFVQVYGAAVEQVHPEQIGTAPITAARNTSPIGSLNSSVTNSVLAPVAANSIAPSHAPSTAPIAINPFSTTPTNASAASSSTTTEVAHVRQASTGSTNSNPFGEINEPSSTTHASGAGLSAPVVVSSGTTGAGSSTITSTTVSNPFEQSTIPSGSGASTTTTQYGSQGGIEGATSTITTSSIAPGGAGLSNASSSVDPLQSSALAKSEHEDESKRQRYEHEQKTANIIGV